MLLAQISDMHVVTAGRRLLGRIDTAVNLPPAGAAGTIEGAGDEK